MSWCPNYPSHATCEWYMVVNVGKVIQGNFEYWVILNTVLKSLLEDWRPTNYSGFWEQSVGVLVSFQKIVRITHTTPFIATVG